MQIAATKFSCFVSLETGEATPFELLEAETEVDATEYVSHKTNELLELHRQGIDIDEYLKKAYKYSRAKA